MQDSFFFHKTHQNLNLLKNTLVSRPVKIFDPHSIFHSTDYPMETQQHLDLLSQKHKYINPFFKENTSSGLTPRNPTKKQNMLKAIECFHLQPTPNSKSNEKRRNTTKTQRMPPLPVYNPSASVGDSESNSNSNARRSTVMPVPMKSSVSSKGSVIKENSFQEQNSSKTTNPPFNSTCSNPRSFSSGSLSFSKVAPLKPSHIPHPNRKIPKIKAKSWVIVEASTGKVLHSLKPKKVREVASLTKIMTCYVVCSFIEKYEINASNYFMKVPKTSVKLGGTSAELERGDHISIKDLLYGLMLPSGNDAAYCLANFFGKLAFIVYQDEKSGLSTRKKKKFVDIYREKWQMEYPYRDFVKFFVCEMNKTARNIGLLNTTFNNPHGLSDTINKSTAEDIAKLSVLALESNLLKEVVNTKEYYCTIKGRDQEIRELCWRNTNELLNKGFNGIKTGNTPSAGPCFAASYQKNGINLVFVVLKTKSEGSRFGDTLKLLKWFLKGREMIGK